MEATAVILAKDGEKPTDLGNISGGLLIQQTPGSRVGTTKDKTKKVS